MKLTVPFLYEAMIIKPRCRKATSVIVRDVMEVEIKEMSDKDFPIAFQIGIKSLRWDGADLWTFDCMRSKSGELNKVLSTKVRQNTEDDENEYKGVSSSAEAPFFNFWDSLDISTGWGPLKDTSLNDESVVVKEEVVCREWVSDNRDVVMAKALKIANSLRIFEGYMYKQVGQPTYYTITLGLGNNHAGTAMFIGSKPPGSELEKFEFTPLEYEQACKYADSTAENRGDTKSLPVRPNCGNVIKVLIPEAVQLNRPN